MTRPSGLKVRPASECRYDVVSLGEVMLRLDPGEGRIRSSRAFRASEGGGEYNVARGSRRAFSRRTAIVTSLVRDEIGLLLEDCILQGGVDTSFINWVESDGVGRNVRNGINFTERGYGVRGAVGCGYRGQTAASQMQPDDVDWELLFGQLGARWLHTGGIFTALSENTAAVAKTAMQVAKKYGTVVSYDLNYRPSLWSSIGGQPKCQEVNRDLAQYVDVMIGNEEDFTASLGFEIEGVNENLDNLEVEAFRAMIDRATETYPNFQCIGTTMRQVRTATVNDWGAVAWDREQGFFQATQRDGLEILDRVGGGDSFASGLIYGLMEFGDIEKAVNYGAAHGALAMTTPGDTSMASLTEIEHLMAGGSARVRR